MRIGIEEAWSMIDSLKEKIVKQRFNTNRVEQINHTMVKSSSSNVVFNYTKE